MLSVVSNAIMNLIMLNVVIKDTIMLSVAFSCYSECLHDECHYAGVFHFLIVIQSVIMLSVVASFFYVMTSLPHFSPVACIKKIF